MNGLRSWVKQNAFLSFLVLTIIFSWWWYPLFLQGTVPLAVLPMGPMLAALVVVPLGFGRSGVKEWLRTGFKWRVRPIWYLIAFGFPILLTAIGAGLNILLGATASTAAWPTDSVDFLVEAVFVFVLVALGEEMGFSAFALPYLLRKRSVLVTVAILALTRIVWHLPLFIVRDTEWPVAVLLVPTQFIFAWIFIRSGGSALMMIISHFSIAVIGSTFFTRLFSGAESTQVVLLQAVAFVIVGIILMVTSDFWRSGSSTPETSLDEDLQTAIP